MIDFLGFSITLTSIKPNFEAIAGDRKVAAFYFALNYSPSGSESEPSEESSLNFVCWIVCLIYDRRLAQLITLLFVRKVSQWIAVNRFSPKSFNYVGVNGLN